MPERAKRRIFEPALAAVLAAVFAFSAAMPPFAVAQGAESSADAAELEDSDDLKKVIDQLNDQIGKKKGEITQIKAQMEAYQRAIETKRKEAVSVQNELAIVQNRIAKTELDISANELEIEATGLEISELTSKIQEKSLKMMRQRGLIGEFIRALHKTDQRTAIDLFLTQKTLSDFFNDVQFLEDSQRELKKALDTVAALKADLEKREREEALKKSHLEEIGKQLDAAKSQLGEQKVAQTVLSDQIRSSETRYRYELAQLQKEVQNINADIAATERRLRKTLDEDRLRKLSGGSGGWGWPVDPSRGITAYFHDPDYPFRHVFEHPAIDVRAAQGTAIRAPKGGYVARAKNAGMGYSYVMLIHDGDISTVYGHVSRIVVAEDTYVEKGDVIAYSGGAPGTPGAGNLTTGAHLHLEFRVGGIPVNPLNYLSL
ncbi:MAG: peptidoglycan DD-metalloendopeptidase family protein [Patescibacteria group bacterium]